MPNDLVVEANGHAPVATPRPAGEPAKATGRGDKGELTAVAWRPASDLPYEEWLRVGGRLGVAGRSVGWWLGDWLRYGTARYGTKYTAALRVTGYDRQTLMNMVYVATRFDISRRRENLSWSHHAELAGLDLCEQERWLDRAIADRLSVRELRLELHCEKRQLSAARNAERDETATSGRGEGTPERSDATGSAGNPDAAGEAPREPESAAGKDDNGHFLTCPHCGRRFQEPTSSLDTVEAS